MPASPAMVVRIAASLEEFKRNLAEGKNQIETTTAAMQKMATSFNGDRMIQAAHNVAAAVNQVGGASKLTESEQARVNATVTKALEKYAALGKEAPKALRDLANETKQTGSFTDTLKEKFSKLGPAILAAFSVAAVTSAIKSYADFTGKIADLSQKTGIGTEALQRLKYAAEQNGATLEQVTGAVTKLGSNLAGGSTSATGALKALGLSFDSIRAMAPDKAFTTISDAIAKIEDPMARSKLAMDLFGKAGADLLPMMRGNLSATAAEAERLGLVMSDSAVQAGDRFGDSMATLTLVGQSLIAQVLTPIIPVLTTVADWMGRAIPAALAGARSAFDFLVQKGLEVNLWFREMVLGIVEVANKVPWLGDKVGATAATIDSLKQSVQVAKGTLAGFQQQTEHSTQAASTSSGTMRTLNLDYEANAKSVSKAEQALEKARKEKEKFTESVRAANVMLVKWRGSTLSTAPSLEGLTRTFVEFGGIADGVINNQGRDFSLMLTEGQIKTDALGNALQVTAIPALGTFAERIVIARDQSTTWRTQLDDLALAFANLGAIGGDSLSSVTRGIGTMVSGFSTAMKGIDGFKGGLKSLGSGDVLGGITSIASGIGGIVAGAQAAIGAVKALWTWARGGEEGTVVNPARDEWFERHGGLKGVNEGVFAATGSLDLAQAVFDARTKADFDAATRAVERALAGGIAGGANMDLLPGSVERNFAGGTGGRFLDFGTATTVNLHGKERVVTEAEGKAESQAWMGMSARLQSIERLLRDQPRAIAVAVQDAVQFA